MSILIDLLNEVCYYLFMPRANSQPMPDKNEKWTLLNPPPPSYDPWKTPLQQTERTPSLYSDQIRLDREQLGLEANGIFQPDLKTNIEILKIDPHAENVNPLQFPSFKRKGKAAIDHDGSPEAYMPKDLGSDDLQNGYSGKKPVGFLPSEINHLGGYVSTTRWQKRGPDNKQASYVDSRRVPYVAMPGKYFKGENRGRNGDFVKLTNKITGRTIWAVVADGRESNDDGIEMSIAAARAIGVEFNRKAATKNYKDITLEAFKGSASGKWYE